MQYGLFKQKKTNKTYTNGFAGGAFTSEVWTAVFSVTPAELETVSVSAPMVTES